MTSQVKLLSAIAAAALLAGVLLVALSQLRGTGAPTLPQMEQAADNLGHDEHGPIAAGEKAAAFKLTDLSGDPVSFAAKRCRRWKSSTSGCTATRVS
jgi:hypothetical protein